MRNVFFKKLISAMEKDERIFFLTAGTGINLVESIFEAFPERTLNVGIAEQNLIGISAGLCNVGFKPVCYAISNFLVHRCLEQTRNDVCLHNYPIILVGTGTGFDNGGLGATHHMVDDIGCIKSLPNMKIYSPSGIEAMENIFNEAMSSNGPAYIRIAKGGLSEGKPFQAINRFIREIPDVEILIISHGKMVKNAVDAAGLSPNLSVFAMDKIKPLDENVLGDLLTSYKKVIVVEDNFKSGLYNSICQFIADKNLKNIELRFIGPEEKYEKYAGDAAYFEDKHGLSPEKISKFAEGLNN